MRTSKNWEPLKLLTNDSVKSWSSCFIKTILDYCTSHFELIPGCLKPQDFSTSCYICREKKTLEIQEIIPLKVIFCQEDVMILLCWYFHDVEIPFTQKPYVIGKNNARTFLMIRLPPNLHKLVPLSIIPMFGVRFEFHEPTQQG